MKEELMFLWKLYGVDNNLSYDEFVAWLASGSSEWFKGRHE